MFQRYVRQGAAIRHGIRLLNVAKIKFGENRKQWLREQMRPHRIEVLRTPMYADLLDLTANNGMMKYVKPTIWSRCACDKKTSSSSVLRRLGTRKKLVPASNAIPASGSNTQEVCRRSVG